MRKFFCRPLCSKRHSGIIRPFMFALVMVCLFLSCAHKNLSHAYPGHGVNRDLNHFLRIHPDAAGTPLDDCKLCHRGGSDRDLTACDHCHAVYNDRGYRATLNVYGEDYLERGRSVQAVRQISRVDSDSDGFSNRNEITELCFPGDKASNPSQPFMPSTTLVYEELSSLPTHTQFMLMNAHRHHDYYVTYAGWNINDLLARAKVSSYSGITVISWDGYQKYFPAEAVNRMYPSALFYGPERFASPNPKCGLWLRYPDPVPPGVKSGETISGELRLILAFAREGESLTPLGRGADGRLKGEGPYRLVVPQKDAAGPDQSLYENNPACPFPFTEEIHHNSGDSIRGVIAILVHPAPPEMREVDWRGLADDLLIQKKLMIFGNINTMKSGGER